MKLLSDPQNFKLIKILLLLCILKMISCDNNQDNNGARPERSGLFAEAIEVSNSNNNNNNHHHHQMPIKKNPVPKFIGKPLPAYRVTEGQEIRLTCQVDRQMAFSSWLKADHRGSVRPLFANTSRSYGVSERFVFSGDMSRGDYSIEINSIKLSDTGQYQCQVRPDEFTEYDDPNEYIIATNITVIEQPPHQLINGGGNSHQADSLTAQSSSSPTATGIDTEDLSLESVVRPPSQMFSPSRAQSQLHARDILPGFTKLSSSPSSLAISSSSSSSSMPSAFINSHPSYPTTRAATSPHGLTSSSALMVAWPYLLLAIAFLLMMANIYLIYSLIKRHISCSSSTSGSSAADLEEQTTTSSNNSGSNGNTNSSSTAMTNNNNCHNYYPPHHMNSILKRPKNP